MSQIVLLPGFDGDATLRREFVAELARRHEAHAVSYPNKPLGSLDQYRVHAMGEVPVDWKPILVAESFGGLVATRWAAMDSRVRALVLCGSFARNPVGLAAAFGASWPGLVKMGPLFTNPFAAASGDARRRRWSQGLTRALETLREDVVAERLRLIATEDVGPVLGGLRIPVVVVQFQDDLVIGPLARGHLESVCHNPHVLRLPGPHFALETRPLESARAILAGLEAVLPSRA
jgi:pimeloyl-[acyl-carrier protein] methyl ester esterase